MLRRISAGVVVALALTACTSPAPGETDEAPASVPPSSPTPTPTRTTPPDPGPRPRVGECHALSFRQAVTVVGRTRPVACRRPHTAQTYFVGRLRLQTDSGHTRRADSQAALRQARTTCTSRLPRHLGQAPRELRLSMAEAVWFTPSPARAEAGADWFRCDVVVVAAPRKLLRLPRRTSGFGDAPAIAMCATAAPGAPGFTRVTCGSRHSWRAVATVDLPGKTVPGREAAAQRMESTCRDAARARTDDPLDFTWSQEIPTREQWDAGQRFGICWVPA